MMSKKKKILTMKEICKSFPGVQALDKVSFDMSKGEVHALVGKNGAGKSTLIKILAGVYAMDSGQINYKGEEIHDHSPASIKASGISFIHQEPSIIEGLTVGENIFLGREPLRKGGIINWDSLYEKASIVLKEVNAEDIDPRARVEELDVVQQQVVAISRVINEGSDILVFDEPTTRLSKKEVDNLFEIIQDLKEKGISSIYVSHYLEEIFEIGDKVTVLRDGKKVGSREIKDLTKDKLVKMMVGERPIEKESLRGGKKMVQEEALLVGKDICNKTLDSIDIEVNPGEIVGILGGVGSGKTNLARSIYGAEPITQGNLFLQGEPYNPRSPSHGVKKRIAFCPRDRRKEGLFLKESVKNNLTLANLKDLSLLSVFPNRKDETQLTESFVEKLDIETPSIYQEVGFLSGGNQQKVVLARWLASSSELFILEEVTRGIDIKTKEEIYRLLDELTQQDKGIILTTSEIPEALHICDKLLVLFKGRCVAICDPGNSTKEQLHSFMMGEGITN